MFQVSGIDNLARTLGSEYQNVPHPWLETYHLKLKSF